jgi:hypothetical protein
MRASDEHILIVRVPRAGGRLGYPSLPLQACSFPLQGWGADWSSTARVERGPSEGARSASTGDQQPLSTTVPRAQITMLLPSLPVPPLKGVVWIYPLLRALTERRPQSNNMIDLVCAGSEHISICSFQACSLPLQGWGLIGLLLRASNEALLRARVPRAQEINSPHPPSSFNSRSPSAPLVGRYNPAKVWPDLCQRC